MCASLSLSLNLWGLIFFVTKNNYLGACSCEVRVLDDKGKREGGREGGRERVREEGFREEGEKRGREWKERGKEGGGGEAGGRRVAWGGWTDVLA